MSALRDAVESFKGADEIRKLAADRVGGSPGDVAFRAGGAGWLLEIACGTHLVLEVKLTMPRSADPSDEEYWTYQLYAAHALLDASEPDPRAD